VLRGTQCYRLRNPLDITVTILPYKQETRLKVEAQNFVPLIWAPRAEGASGATGYARDRSRSLEAGLLFLDPVGASPSVPIGSSDTTADAVERKPPLVIGATIPRGPDLLFRRAHGPNAWKVNSYELRVHGFMRSCFADLVDLGAQLLVGGLFVGIYVLCHRNMLIPSRVVDLAG